MKYFHYQGDDLLAEKTRIADINDQIATPFYCYSKEAIVNNYQAFAKAFSDIDHKICYAVKANCNLNIVRILAGLGAGADVLSQGEIFRSLKAGISPEKIVFAGVGKTAGEIEFALNNGVKEFSVESEPELFLLSEVATKLNKIAKVAVRVNPNIDAKTHDKISTGRKGDKFGIDIDCAFEVYQKARSLKGIEVFGIATHIGSQITSLKPFHDAFTKIREFCLKLRSNNFAIDNLDLGGGIGITYNQEVPIKIADYTKMIKEIIGDLNVKLTIAPGRAIVGDAGILVTKALYVKKTNHKNFLIIDAAMNDLMRPSLYDSYHNLLPVKKKIGEVTKFDVVGPICETTDVLAKNRDLAGVQSGDLLAFETSGAYGSSMSNEYNSRPLIPEVLVDKNNFKLIRRRPSYEDMVFLEV